MSTRIVVVPDCVSEAINRAIDAAIVDCPDAEKDRASFYNDLLAYYDEHGEIPQFKIEKKP